LFAPNLAQRRQSKLQKEVEEAESRMQEIQLQIEMEHTKERLVWSQLSSVEKLQKQMARDQIALAEFSLGEKRSFVWLFTPGGVYFEFLPARQEIEKSVRAYLGLLASPPNPLSPEKDILKVREQGETLFTRLFGDLSRHIIPGQRLVIVPDGLLHYLPFEALIRDGRYLVEDNEISYNSSASMLNLWQDSGRRVDSDRRELLAVGDPIFQPKATAGLKQANRLAPLPRTRDEVEYITSLFPPGARKVLLGAEATERAFKGESLRRYRRLHFATHSLIDEQSASRSAVVLSPDDDALEDGLLEVGEVSGLDLDCDLVVLSACQTGRGRLFSGEGIVGLSRAFLYAGARSVIMSLWNVSDLSTGQLMKDFYRNLTSGLSNAAALREAKLRMVGGGKQTRHPYYWSCFVMVGKP
jgi:CHAT domain-containing protein